MTIDFEKCGGLVPAIVQDAVTKNVLMLGYMNAEAYAKTQETGRVTFFSRSRQKLWTKGEESGNYLALAVRNQFRNVFHSLRTANTGAAEFHYSHLPVLGGHLFIELIIVYFCQFTPHPLFFNSRLCSGPET